MSAARIFTSLLLPWARSSAPARRDTTAGGVLFAVFQNGSHANGGVESITQIIEGLDNTSRVVLTNAESPMTTRWRRASAETSVWNLPYAFGPSWRKSGLASLVRRLCNLIATNWWTWRILKRRKLDVVHCNDPAPFWYVALGARLAGAPLILNLRDTKTQEEGLDIAKYRRRFRLCERVLVLSSEMKEFYAQACGINNGQPSPPIQVIYSVVDFKRMAPLAPHERARLRTQLGIPDQTFALGFIATFNDKKNQLDYLREAVPMLRDLCPAARTFFVGDFEPETKPYARACLEAVRTLGLQDHANFVGFRSQVEEWYQVCDLVIVPTRKEGLARCMIEALACGTPVVSFDVCSAREILEAHGCGHVIAQGDYRSFCEGIAAFFRSPEIRREHASRALSVSRKLFSPEGCIQNYRKLLGSLEGKNRRPNCSAIHSYGSIK